MSKVKILKVSLKDFESHADSEIYFNEGFNALVGSSCSGKSSILRAIRTVTTPRGFCTSWVREGRPFCTIKIESTVGYLEARKGDGVNEFSYFIDGETPEQVDMKAPGDTAFDFSKKILGIDTMRIESTGAKKTANKRLDVNMMRQSEPAGLLDASGKSKAFVFDCLCGIEDSEGIREGLKNGVTSRNKKNDELITSLTSIRAGGIEEKKLQGAREEYNGMADDYDVILEQKKNIQEVTIHQTQHSLAVVSVQQIEAQLSDPAIKVPERAVLASFALNSPLKIQQLTNLSALHQKHKTTVEEVDATQKALTQIPTIEATTIEDGRKKATMLSLIGRSLQADGQVEAIMKELSLVGPVGDTSLLVELLGKSLIVSKHNSLSSELKKINDGLLLVGDCAIETSFSKSLIEKILQARDMYKRLSQTITAVGTLEKDVKDCCNSVELLKESLVRLLDGIDKCPTTGKPLIGDGCSLLMMKQMKGK